jgi:hypothetical protein
MNTLTGARRMLMRLAAIPIAAAVFALAFAVPASAGLAAGRAAAPDARVTLHTLVAHLRVRARPSTRARVTGQIARKGARVTVNCWATGTRVRGNRVWYHLDKPRTGYVTAGYVDTHFDPAAGVPRCRRGPFRRSYRTLVTGLRVRTGPSSRFRTVGHLGGFGSKITVSCFAFGQSVRGDRVWYHIVAPRHGFVAGRFLNTGHDPAPGVPRC